MTDGIREVAPEPTLHDLALTTKGQGAIGVTYALLHLADTVDRAADRVANAIAGLVGGQQ